MSSRIRARETTTTSTTTKKFFKKNYLRRHTKNLAKQKRKKEKSSAQKEKKKPGKAKRLTGQKKKTAPNSKPLTLHPLIGLRKPLVNDVNLELHHGAQRNIIRHERHKSLNNLVDVIIASVLDLAQ